MAYRLIPVNRINKFFSLIRLVDECWEWQGGFTGGYPAFTWKSEQYGNRSAYLMFCGDIPTGLHVLHSCDNPKCVNPDHLWLGTIADNNRDAWAKGRSSGGSLPGDSNPNAKLTIEDVKWIREIYRKGRGPLLARRYGMSRKHLIAVARGRSYKC